MVRCVSACACLVSSSRARQLAFWSIAVAAAALVVVWLAAAPVRGELPAASLTSVFPAGGKAGGTVDVLIAGSDLDDAAKLFFSHPGITAVAKMSAADASGKPPKPVLNTFTVTIAANVPPGVYESRAAGLYGVSGPRAFQVSGLNEVLGDNTNKTIPKALELAAGSVINGRLDAESSQYFKLSLKATERVFVECFARRIDSRLDGVLVLLDANKREITRNRRAEGRDPVLEVKAPADGIYYVGLSDFTFAGGADYFYRLAVHSAPRIDAVYPPVVAPGAATQVTLYGRNLPGGQPAPGMQIDGKPLEQLTVSVTAPGDEAAQSRLDSAQSLPANSASLDGFTYQLASPAGPSNPVTLFLATAPVILEQEPNDASDKAQKINVPCEFVGQFGAAQDRDYVQFDAKKGDMYSLEVISQRMGRETDPVLVVQKIAKDAKGVETTSEVAAVDDLQEKTTRSFDLSTTDPSYRLKVDADATYRVLVKNQYSDSRVDPRRAYRLVIRKAAGDFRLAVAPLIFTNQQDNNKTTQFAPVLRQGGAALFLVQVFRRDGFDGEISVTAEGLPAGVTCSGAVLGGEVDTAQLHFAAAENTPPWVGAVKIVGKSSIGGKEAVREARLATLVWAASTANNQTIPAETRLARDLVLSVVEKELSPASVTAGEGKLIETAPGGKVEVPLKLARRNFTEALKLAPMGLPDTLKPADINIAAGSGDGKFELTLSNQQIKPGAYTFCLRGDAKIKYERNPGAIKAVEAEKQEVDTAAKEMSAKSKEAVTAAQNADKASQAAAAQVKTTEAAKTAADTAAKAAADKSKQAADALAAAKKAAQADAANKALADAAAAAEKTAAQADADGKKAAEQVAAAAKAVTDAQEAAKKATEAKAAADKVAAEADGKSKMLEQRKTMLDQQLQNLKKDAGAKDNTISVVSSPIKLRIAPAPVTISPMNGAMPMKQGASAELPVSVARLFGYAEAVEVVFEAPPGVAGLSGAKLDLPKDQTAGKLKITAGGDTPPGEYTGTVRAKAKWNNVSSEITQTVVVKVEPK